MNLSRLLWWMGAVLVALAVIVCLVPSHDLPEQLELSDKVSHLIGHGALALYFTGIVPRRSWWKIFVFLLVLGIAIEFAQYYMHAGREGDPRDVVANSVGALLGLVLGWIGLARWPELAARILGQSRAAP
jgi:VanZ family protein